MAYLSVWIESLIYPRKWPCVACLYSWITRIRTIPTVLLQAAVPAAVPAVRVAASFPAAEKVPAVPLSDLEDKLRHLFLPLPLRHLVSQLPAVPVLQAVSHLVEA